MITSSAIIHSFYYNNGFKADATFFVVKSAVKMAIPIKMAMRSKLIATAWHGSLGHDFFLRIDPMYTSQKLLILALCLLLVKGFLSNFHQYHSVTPIQETITLVPSTCLMYMFQVHI